MLNLKQIDARISDFNKVYYQEISDLALQVFNEVVVPFCQKHNLKYFVEGNNWYFENQAGERVIGRMYINDLGDLKQWQESNAREITNVIDILDLEPNALTLGEFMPNYEGE